MNMKVRIIFTFIIYMNSEKNSRYSIWLPDAYINLQMASEIN